MISSAGVAIAAITVMLWILWSDTIRKHRPTPILYSVRVLLYLGMAAVIITNMVRYPYMFAGGTRWLAIVAIAIAFLGAGYFASKMIRR